MHPKFIIMQTEGFSDSPEEARYYQIGVRIHPSVPVYQVAVMHKDDGSYMPNFPLRLIGAEQALMQFIIEFPV